MLKNIIVSCLAIFLFSPGFTFAQPYVEVGAKGGLNVSNIRNLRVSGTINRNAPAAGIFASTFLSERFAIQSELLYMGKGDRIELPSGEREDQVVTIKLNYLELPVLAKLQGSMLADAEVGLYAGPAFAWKLNESLDDPTSDENSSEEQEMVKGTDTGLAVGAEFGIRLGRAKLLFDIRLTPGLREIAQGPQLPSEASNQTISIMTGFTF